MNPNNSQPSFELPPVPSEGGGDYGRAAEHAPGAPEQKMGLSAPLAGSASSQLPINPSIPIAQPIVPPSQLVSSAPSATNPTTADDSDLIEKEWVVKAKQIVAATKDDPFKQNREINKFKADYLKKRYNKDLKIEEA